MQSVCRWSYQCRYISLSAQNELNSRCPWSNIWAFRQDKPVGGILQCLTAVLLYCSDPHNNSLYCTTLNGNKLHKNSLHGEHYASKLEVILIKQAAWDRAIQKLHGSHHCWMSWSAWTKGDCSSHSQLLLEKVKTDGQGCGFRAPQGGSLLWQLKS